MAKIFGMINGYQAPAAQVRSQAMMSKGVYATPMQKSLEKTTGYAAIPYERSPESRTDEVGRNVYYLA